MLVLADGRKLIVPADTVGPSDKLRVIKLFDRFKHYYTSISCWAGGARTPLLLHPAPTLAFALRPPPASSAAPPLEPFATLRTPAVPCGPTHACARP
jgi:hypothetical protein